MYTKLVLTAGLVIQPAWTRKIEEVVAAHATNHCFSRVGWAAEGLDGYSNPSRIGHGNLARHKIKTARTLKALPFTSSLVETQI